MKKIEEHFGKYIKEFEQSTREEIANEIDELRVNWFRQTKGGKSVSIADGIDELIIKLKYERLKELQ